MSKAAADRYQRQLLALLKEPGNDQCADCKARNPRWASWDQGVFLCVQCASMHRKLGSHITKVKSVTLDTWTKEQVDNMRRLGNVKVNSLLNPDERRNPPPPPDSGDERNGELERFIRNKYEYRVFAISPPPSPTPRAANGASNGGNLYAPPSDPPPPILPYRPPASAAPPPPSSAFGSSFLSPPSSSAFPASSSPSFPPRPSPTAARAVPTPSPPRGPKSVRFPDLPPTIIPSDTDSDDDEIDDPYGPSSSSSAPSSRSTLKRPRAPSASLLPPRKGVLRRSAPGASSEIFVDWAAFTRDSSLSHDDGDEDVSLASLGALGMRGAQVGMAGVYAPNGGGAMGVLPPQSQSQSQAHGHPQAPFAVPYGAGVGQQAMAAPAFSGGGGGGMPAVAPLQPQYTGSAKGYLHQQREHQHHRQQQQQQGLQPQQTGTGIDAFQQMFQPPGQRGSPNPFQQQQQQQLQQQQQQQQQSSPQQRTNPFHAHLFDRNAYSPSPQPPQGSSSPSPQPAPPTQPQAPPDPSPTLFGTATQHAQTQKAMDDIWAGLDFLGGGGSSSSNSAAAAPSSSFLAAPQPQQHFGGPPSASPFGSSAPSPAPQQQPQAPAPLRPQLTGFIPSSSFGQQLARESSPFAPSPSQQQQPPALSLQIPGTPGNHASSQPPSPAPFLQPQRTGFVPSSAFGQDLAARGSSPAANAPPAPLQPQRTGFVPSSRFGMELAQEQQQQQQASSSAFGGVRGERAVSPAPFDFPSAPPPAPPPQQQQRPNPFASIGQMGAALPGTQQQQQQQQQSMLMAAGQQQAGYRGSPNPFLQPQAQAQRPQLTGFAGAGGMAPMQQPPQQTGYGLQPQLTGFGGGGGGNPFLAFQQQQQQQQGGGGGWR
ncbi:hypothetical protein Rhopal_005349-T1 [Rhodotorula paludigena]|uniref:Arf-GAP domain-containing protein n=1 Tax=Rhodotorula paludigena TaxID=86838 RepID=A0AAV5GPA8_9BASI|nr:hypothetical protein Rhopal_005349-T1 [Rhodotorula paludigena]